MNKIQKFKRAFLCWLKMETKLQKKCASIFNWLILVQFKSRKLSFFPKRIVLVFIASQKFCPNYFVKWWGSYIQIIVLDSPKKF